MEMFEHDPLNATKIIEKAYEEIICLAFSPREASKLKTNLPLLFFLLNSMLWSDVAYKHEEDSLQRIIMPIVV